MTEPSGFRIDSARRNFSNKKPKSLDFWASRRLVNRIRRLKNHVEEDLRRDCPSIGGIAFGGVAWVLAERQVRLVFEIDADAIRIHDEVRVTEF